MAFTATHTIGGDGGENFSYYGGTDGKVLERIAVWAARTRIKAIRVWLTDEDPKTFGEPSRPHDEGNLEYKEFFFDTAERIVNLSLWGDTIGTRTGWIKFTTNTGKIFDFGMYGRQKGQEYGIDVGSGICVGVSGGHGIDIDRLAFVFLKKIAYSKIYNVKYPTLRFDSTGITPETFDQFIDTNKSDTDINWEFSNSREVTSVSKWSVTAGLTVLATGTVEAGVPGVAKVGAKFGWQLSGESTYETSTTKTMTLSWKGSGTLKPGESINVVAVTRTGVLNIPYEGYVELTLTSGYKFSYRLEGQYSGVSYSQVELAATPPVGRSASVGTTDFVEGVVEGVITTVQGVVTTGVREAVGTTGVLETIGTTGVLEASEKHN